MQGSVRRGQRMLRINLSNQNQNEQLDHPGGPLEFGRGPQRQAPRFLVEDAFVSRDHLRVEELPQGRVQVANLSQRWSITFGDGVTLGAGATMERALPVSL